MLKATVIGNLGYDADVKRTQSGREYLSFAVAHDQGKDKPSVWVSVAWFGGQDHALAKYIKKGAKVAVTGDLSARIYTGRDGTPRCSLDLFADSVDMILFPRREEGAAPAAQAAPAPAPQTAASDARARLEQARAFGPGNPEYDKMPDFLKDEDVPF